MTLKDFMNHNNASVYTVMVGEKKKRYTPRIIELRFDNSEKYNDAIVIDDFMNGTTDSFGKMFVHIEYKELPTNMYTTTKKVLNGKKVKPFDKTTPKQEKRRSKGGILGLF
jgi:hypothetical protein